ncbi:MAG: hypothetical protein RLY23_414 [Actinomycetota bacterium]|jgi:hypothetical protein
MRPPNNDGGSSTSWRVTSRAFAPFVGDLEPFTVPTNISPCLNPSDSVTLRRPEESPRE